MIFFIIILLIIMYVFYCNICEGYDNPDSPYSHQITRTYYHNERPYYTHKTYPKEYPTFYSCCSKDIDLFKKGEYTLINEDYISYPSQRYTIFTI